MSLLHIQTYSRKSQVSSLGIISILVFALYSAHQITTSVLLIEALQKSGNRELQITNAMIAQAKEMSTETFWSGQSFKKSESNILQNDMKYTENPKNSSHTAPQSQNMIESAVFASTPQLLSHAKSPMFIQQHFVVKRELNINITTSGLTKKKRDVIRNLSNTTSSASFVHVREHVHGRMLRNKNNSQTAHVKVSKTVPFKVAFRIYQKNKNRLESDLHQKQSSLLFDDNSSLFRSGILPFKPICPLCLRIVESAPGVNITYEHVMGEMDVSKGTALHQGATFANSSTVGYVHDASALRQHPPNISWSDQRLHLACSFHDATYIMVHQKIRVVTEDDLEQQRQRLRRFGVPCRRERLFCMIYSTESARAKVQRIRETWGPKCDGFMIASNRTDPTFDAVNITHNFEEEYENMWQKVRTMWSYVYDNYYDEYDWFHIGGDDLFLIVENLRYYLESEEIKTAANGGIYLPNKTMSVQKPLYLGCRHRYKENMNDLYNSGGSGYTLNKAALKALVVYGLPRFFVNERTAVEDVMIARVFRKIGIHPYETKDETGAERYNPLSPGSHYLSQRTKSRANWYKKFSIYPKLGFDHSSMHSVAFHYIRGDDMYRLHALLYQFCPIQPSMLNTTTSNATPLPSLLLPIEVF